MSKLTVARVLAAMTGGWLLSIPYLDPELYIFSWVAFVPLLFAIHQLRLFSSYCLGLIFGLTFYTSIAYWAVDFLMLSKGFSAVTGLCWAGVFWLYCAQLPAFLTLVFKGLTRHSQIHEFIVFPLVVVTFYSAFPMLFSVQLGESQSRFLPAIQAVEFVGVYGLDALIALVNIVIFRWLLPRVSLQERSSQDRHSATRNTIMASCVIALWFAYGLYANGNWQADIAQWQTVRVGIVQPNEMPTLEALSLYPGYSRSYPPEMAMTERLKSAGASLVIWPEARYKAYLDRQQVRAAYKNTVAELNVHLLFQDIDTTENADNRQPSGHSHSKQYNTAAMLNPDGELAGSYQKIKRVAFGEYVPLVSDIPVLRQWIEGFFGKFLNEMDAGSDLQSFDIGELQVIPLICYETMFPEFVAQAASVAKARKPVAGLLAGLSSNGWFGTTLQPYQHVHASVLRAVENRLPLVHAVNNGPSMVALPNGRVIFMSDYHQPGGYIVDVPYSEKGGDSFFRQHPYLFINGVYGLLLVVVVRTLVTSRRFQ